MGDGSAGGKNGRVAGSGLLFAMLAAALVVAPIARGAAGVWAATAVELVIYLAVCLWLLMVVNRTMKNGGWPQPLVPRGRSLDAPIALLAVLAATSFAFSIYKHDSFCALLRLFAYIGLYYMAANAFDHMRRKRFLVLAISVGSFLSAYGLLQYFGVFGHSWWYPPQFPAATYVNHNHFAGYLEMALPVAAAILSMRWTQRRAAFNAAMAAAVILMAAALIVSQSRGAWVSLASASTVACLVAGRKGLKRSGKLLIAIMVIASLALMAYFGNGIISERLSTITEARPGEDISGGRLMIWQGALGMICQRPLTGAGIGNFDHGFYRYRPLGFNARAVYAHNDYLQAAAEMGVLAPLVMVWLFAAAVQAGLRTGENPYAFGCAIGVLSLSFHGLVDFNFHIPANMVLFVLWIAIIMGEAHVKRI